MSPVENQEVVCGYKGVTQAYLHFSPGAVWCSMLCTPLLVTSLLLVYLTTTCRNLLH